VIGQGGGPVADVLIRGGTVVDGTGAAPSRADVLVKGSTITAVREAGRAEAEAARAEVDATGQVVCPGFIDLHSHADFSILGHPAADTALTQGVTTLLTGNCGWSPFPLTDTETLPRATAFLDPELDWSWTDAAGYASAVGSARPAVNLALQVGHSALRLAVLGADERTPEGTELKQMCALLEQAAGHGVHGFSTGLIYAPGCYADPEEVTALATVAANCGLLYSTHMRNEADQLLPAVTEALSTAAASGARLEISHLKAMGRPNHGLVTQALQRIDRALDDGVDVGCDMYPYTASSTTLTSRLPTWAMRGGVTALLSRLADTTTRTRIASELQRRLETDFDPDGVVVAALPTGPYSDTVGSTLTQIGARLDVGPEEAALRLLEAHQGAVAVVNHAMAEEDVTAVLQHPRASVASDGWTLRPTGAGVPHPRSFGTFTRVLGRYVRDRGDLQLADAVAKMTSQPAARAGLTGRGELVPGAVADIAVFDPDRVTDRSTFSDPWRLSVGVRSVLVSGELALVDGQLTGRRAGAVLRKG
jgi:N-acyl-D-amino-acid deacylase